MVPAQGWLARGEAGAERKTPVPSLSSGKSGCKGFQPPQPCPGIQRLPALTWSPTTPKMYRLRTPLYFSNNIRGCHPSCRWNSVVKFLEYLGDPMLGHRGWGRELGAFSFSPLSCLGCQAQEVRAGGEWNTGGRKLASSALSAAAPT